MSEKRKISGNNFIVCMRGFVLFYGLMIPGGLAFGGVYLNTVFDRIALVFYIATVLIAFYTVWLSSPKNLDKKLGREEIIIFFIGTIMFLGILGYRFVKEYSGTISMAVLFFIPYLIVWGYLLARRNVGAFSLSTLRPNTPSITQTHKENQPPP